MIDDIRCKHLVQHSKVFAGNRFGKFSKVNVSVCAGSTPATIAAKAASTMVPIVFYGGTDPVSMGLIASFSRPGGNVTGVTTLNVEIGAKRLELLHELVPTATIIAALVNPTSPALAEPETRDLQAAARMLRSMCCTPAADRKSKRPSRPWFNCAQARW